MNEDRNKPNPDYVTVPIPHEVKRTTDEAGFTLVEFSDGSLHLWGPLPKDAVIPIFYLRKQEVDNHENLA